MKIVARYVTKTGLDALTVKQSGPNSFSYIGKHGAGSGPRSQVVAVVREMLKTRHGVSQLDGEDFSSDVQTNPKGRDMATKKPTAAQLAARERFAELVRSGKMPKRRRNPVTKPAAKAPVKRAAPAKPHAKNPVRTVIVHEIRDDDGKLVLRGASKSDTVAAAHAIADKNGRSYRYRAVAVPAEFVK